MAELYAYNLAQLDPTTNMCIGVATSTDPEDLNFPNVVEIPVYDEEYICKYYINGNWYEDAAGTIPWSSSLL